MQVVFAVLPCPRLQGVLPPAPPKLAKENPFLIYTTTNPPRDICAKIGQLEAHVPVLSGTESSILNRESSDSESCDLNRAIPRLL